MLVSGICGIDDDRQPVTLCYHSAHEVETVHARHSNIQHDQIRHFVLDKQKGLAAYTKRKAQARTWLQERAIPHYIPPALPSEAYADASHPLGEGYALLAQELLENEAFIRFTGEKGPRR